MNDLFDDFDDDEFDGDDFDEGDYDDDDGFEDYDSDGDELDEYSFENDVGSGEKAFNEEGNVPVWWEEPRLEWPIWMYTGPLSENIKRFKSQLNGDKKNEK